MFATRLGYVYCFELTGVHIADVGMTSATVYWTTDEPATSQVEYGEKPECNLTTPLDEALVTEHQVRLTGLKPETDYCVRVRSRNASGEEVVSDYYFFTTRSSEQPPEQPPLIKDVTFTNSTYYSVVEKPTGWFKTGQEADIVLNWFGFNNSGGPCMFNHPGGIATDGRHLVLADTWNNRVLIWNELPEGNEPPDIVLGQKNFYSCEPGVGPDKFNWPVGVATDGTHLFVADTWNDRVLVWTEFPTENGEPADLVLGAPDFYTRAREVADARDPKQNIIWPWAVWTDGEKLVVTSTGSASVLIWNNLPTKMDQPADIVLARPGIEFGTPRSIGSDGEHLVIGDHNAHVGDQDVGGNFFWREFPTTDNEPYDFFMSDPVEGKQLIWGCTFSGGKFIGLTYRLFIWNSFPEDANDEPDLTVNVNALSSGWGDGSSIAVADGKLYISLSNGNKIVAYNSLPTEPDQEPDFAVGAPDIDTNTLATNCFIGNPVVASDGQHLFAISDFSDKMCVWKRLPDESGAKPDIVYHLDFAPWDIALHNGTLVIGGKDIICVWDNLPLNGELPDLTIRSEFGSVEFRDITGVALDDRYFYVLDMEAGEIYVWEGIPREPRDPKYVISAGPSMRILSSDGEHLAVTSFERQSVLIYSIEGIPRNEEPIILSMMEGGITFNLPEGVFVDGEHLFVADTCSSRVLIWNKIPTRIGQPPDIVLGEDDFEDRTPEAKKDKLFWPKGIWFDGSYLWVGEFKFSNRIVRFPLIQDIAVLSPCKETYETNSVPLTFTLPHDVSWIGYSVDDKANVTVDGNTTLAGLPDGRHRLIVYAENSTRDMLCSNPVYFTVDTTPPVASFTYSPSTPNPGETVSFDASSSYDANGTVTNYAWSFGDGADGSGITTTHTYDKPGTYTVVLTVSDRTGKTATCTNQVIVSTPTSTPQPTTMPTAYITGAILAALLSSLAIILLKRRRASTRT